jgi:ABC-type phosphate/phosphonate transport system ATPase subunit
MKFVTVMDMWLLILNICLIGGLFYYGRRLLKAVERAVNHESQSVKAERDAIIKMLHKEADSYQQQMSMIDSKSTEWLHLDDQLQVLKELSAKIEKRNK